MTQEPPPGSPMSERMQSLLSRAVEDQLSEQRQLAGVLGEVHAQLSHIAGRLDAVGAGGGDTGAVEQAVSGVTADLREAVRVLAQRLDAIGAMVQQRGADLAALTTAVGKLQEAADAHATAIHDMRQAFTGVASRTAQFPTRDEVAGMVDAATGRLAEHVDAAAFALAEVVVRRRSGRSGRTTDAAPTPTTASAAGPTPTAVPPTAAAPTSSAPGPTPTAAPPTPTAVPVAPAPPAAGGSPEEADDKGPDDQGPDELDDELPDDDEDGGVSNQPPWQTPVAPPATAPTPTTIIAAPEEPAKRKPWWRPSE